ncbi:hypothetical protein [Campylobacter showae]|uniref:hypothetical protein n=1 Tax=Campylobacter showae TaxID=204 RepID=UPI001F13D274|nr:hypothetical protein [Campylobacter showae]
MKNKTLFIALVLSIFSLNVFAKVDCNDPKNRPKYIGGGGVMIGGKMECSINRGTAERAKRDLDTTIGRNLVTGKVTSKAELADADNPTMNLETAQMNFGKAKTELEEAQKVYTDDASVKNSRRVDIEAAEEIKEKADKKKDK